MRWETLTEPGTEQQSLPGYGDQAVVRRFEAPEALDMRFYEVHARSALNRVPDRSQVPFRWTVNPYRGCSHACVYCLAGETQILMADGAPRALADLEVGAAIYGTRGTGGRRRLVSTRVLAKWSTVKPAYRIALADGSELVASGDHRLLTPDGWRHVAESEHGSPGRPHLGAGSRLVVVGALGDDPSTAGGPGPAVASIERLSGTRLLFDVTTGTGDFIANGVVSHNCFARPTHTYLGFDAGRDFEREIVVKVNAPEVLRRELARPRWTHEHVAVGTNTDPYQWVEARYRLMPGIWEALRDSATPCSVLTKSPLVLRDIDLLSELAGLGLFSAALSVPTLDQRMWRATEPHTPHPRARLEAVAELTRAGIPTSVLVAPLMPGVNDDPKQVREILEQAQAAGARNVTPIALHLRPGVRAVFMDWLEVVRPDLVERYAELYGRGSYAPREERDRLTALVRGPPGRGGAPRFHGRRTPVRAPRRRASPEPEPARQDSLF